MVERNWCWIEWKQFSDTCVNHVCVAPGCWVSSQQSVALPLVVAYQHSVMGWACSDWAGMIVPDDQQGSQWAWRRPAVCWLILPWEMLSTLFCSGDLFPNKTLCAIQSMKQVKAEGGSFYGFLLEVSSQVKTPIGKSKLSLISPNCHVLWWRLVVSARLVFQVNQLQILFLGFGWSIWRKIAASRTLLNSLSNRP